jgi:putative OPT family oligopeptide transporter
VSVAPVAAVAQRELTLRAVLVGCGIGTLLAAGNVYTSLKIGFIDGGSISAAVLGFAFFAVLRRVVRLPYTAKENNITQTTAASAAVMSFVLGAGGPLSVLGMMGHQYPAWQLVLWTMSLGLLGIFVAALLRNKLIVVEELPFPTGAATAEVIETIHTTRDSAMERARLLALAALAAMFVTWYRDGSSAWIPQVWMPSFAIGGVAATALTIGINWSPLLAATGVFTGLRGAASMLVGAGLSWVVLAPWLVNSGIVASASYSLFAGWLVWPSLGLMLASTFLPLVLDWRSAWRSLRDLSAVVRVRTPSAAAGQALFPFQKTLLVLCIAASMIMAWVTFGLHPLVALAALILSVIMGGICARAAGETDIAPVGQMGITTLLGFGSYGTVPSVVAGSVSQGSSSQVSQMLWAFKAGHRLKAAPRAQMFAQIIGALLGAVVVVPVYLVITRVYTLGSVAMPSPAAQSWRATAEAVHGGLASLPRLGPAGALAGFAVGIGLTLLSRSRVQRFIPSPTAIGIAMLMPASLTIAMFIGASIAALARRRWPQLSETALSSVAAGCIAGESIMGVIVAAMIALGLG